MLLDRQKGMNVEELLKSHDFRLLRHPESRLDDVKFTDENRLEVAQRIIDFLDSTGQTLDEDPAHQKVFLIVNKFTPSESKIEGKDCDDLDAVIFFYTEEDAQRIPYKFVLPVEDVQVTEEV